MNPHSSLHRFLIVAAIVSGMALTQCTAQTEKPISGGVELDLNSKYVWHGLIFTDEFVIQPSAWISAHDFTFSIWNNQVPGSEDGIGTGDEIDLAVAHEREFGELSAEFEFACYFYPDQEDAPATGELSVRLVRVVDNIEFSTGHSIDVIEYGGAYFGDIQAGINRGLAVRTNLNLSAMLGWASSKFNETYAGVDKHAFNLFGGAATLQWTVTDDVYLYPHLKIYRILDDAIAAANKRDVFCAGVAAGIEF